MRSPARSILAFIASLAMLVSVTGLAAAARQPDAGRAAGTSYMGVFGGHSGEARPSAGKGGAKNLLSNGGAIQVTPVVYISFWGPEWTDTTFTSGGYTYKQAMDYNTGFFYNVGGSAWNEVVTQYCQGVARGTTTCPSTATFISNPTGQLAGSWIDLTAVPSSPTQSDIIAAAKRAASHFNVSAAAQANATFMVYTPHNKSMSGFAATGGNWCAWHSSTTNSGAKMAYAYIPYMPDAGTSCGMNFVNTTNNSYGNGYFDGFSVVAGHEYSEAETDPFPSSGWTDRSGSENADKCAWSSKSANITLNKQLYAVQPTWSNKISGCPTVS